MKFKIAYCGPVSLHLLNDLVEDGASLPEGYTYPLGAYLIRQYLDRGHEVAVITCANQVPSPQSWYGENISIHLSPRRRARLFLVDFYKRERAFLLKHILETNPDIVHAQWTYEFAHAACDSGFPYLVTTRDAPWAIFRFTRSWYRLYRALYSHLVVPKIENLSAVSEYVAETFRTTFRINDIHIIPNGLSEKFFNNKSKVLIGDDSLNFITVSGWDPWKNVKDLLRAFNQVNQKIPNANLLLIGRGLDEAGPAREWANRRGLSKGVRFLGPMSHALALDTLRNQGNIFVNTTLEESFCMTVLEAMAQGLPVVAYPDSGAVPWLLDYGKAGILAQKQNWFSFSEAMLSATGNFESLNRVARRGYDRAKQSFTLERVVDQYLKALEGILKKGGQEA